MLASNEKNDRDLQGRDDCYQYGPDFNPSLCGEGKPITTTCLCSGGSTKNIINFKDFRNVTNGLITGKFGDACTYEANGSVFRQPSRGFAFTFGEFPDKLTVKLTGSTFVGLAAGEKGLGDIPDGPSYVYVTGNVNLDLLYLPPPVYFKQVVTKQSGQVLDLCKMFYG
jgi:hypothetical protein